MLMHPLPNGSVTHIRPKDGEKYIMVGHNGPEEYVWCDLYGQWYRTEDVDTIVNRLGDSKLKCECGKERHGFANHANWCDLVKKQS